ncbi:MAG: ABC transporter permease subunit, partial [Halobacteriales archaeon]|nr:ABC transporter permease subunit [Halobacteriales archaeon]
MSTVDLSRRLQWLAERTPSITRLVTEQLVLKAAAFIVLYLSVTPFIFVIWTSFWTGRIGSLQGAFTIENYVAMYSSAEVYLLFINTITITLGMFAIAMGAGVTMSWLIGRTNIPTKGYLELVILAPYAIPSFIYALMFIFAFSPKAGLVNHYWTVLTGIQAPLFDIYTVWGILFVMGVDATTTVYLITIPSMTNMDPNLEESSRIHGANMLETIRRVSLPVVVPSLASAGIIVLIRGIGTFASVAVIGVRFGFDVFATKIWEVTSQQFPPDYGFATALSVTLILMTGFLILTYRRITKRKEDYMVVTGEGYRPATWDLGRWKWPITVVIWAVMLLVWITPIIIVFLASFHTLWAGAREQATQTHDQKHAG